MQSDIIAAIITGASTIIAGILGLYKLDRNSKNTNNPRVFSGGVFAALLVMLLCVFIFGIIAGKNIYSTNPNEEQGFTVNIDGKNIKVTPEAYEALYNDKIALEQAVTATPDDSPQQTPTDSPVTPTKRSDYLIYFLEPYQTGSYTKITDNSMKMGGKSYNNGFQLKSSYDDSNALFNFEGKYTAFMGIIGCDDKSEISSITVEFYGDNILLNTMVLNRGDLPQTFSIDVSGVSKFEVKLLDNFTGYVNFADLKVK